jgi:hypothetical protein
MTPATAVELAYVLGEQMRCRKLVEALTNAQDVGFSAKEPILLNVMKNSAMTYPELPHLFFRSLFENGALVAVAKIYLNELNRTLSDQFGIVIEE